MTGIEPEIWVERAAAAVDFYGRAFGATVLHQAGSGDDIVARLEVDGARFWVAAADPAVGRRSPGRDEGATARFMLVVDEPGVAFDRAIDSGARELSPLTTEHGWTVGRVVDPFGHEWEIARPGA